MRQLSSYVVTAALAFVGVGCDRSAASTPSPSRTGEFRVLIPARPATLNPNLELDELASVVGRSVFNHLLSLNESGRLLPELAESWAVSPDGQTYTFKLHSNVRWHDGARFSSADVGWTFETVGTHGYAKDALEPVASIDTPDPATVVIRLKSAWAPFASDLAGPGLAILPRHLYQGRDWRTHPANHAPVGTGPFRFSSWEDDTIVLSANPQYFRSGPYVQRLIFTAVAADAMGEKLMRGEADYSVTRPPSLDLRAPPPEPLAIRTLPTSARIYVAMNLRRPPLNDVRVRRAIAAAVDRLELVSAALGGLAAPAIGWYTPDVEWAYNANARVPDYDLAASRRLLDSAGWRAKGGERFRAALVVPNTAPLREIASVLEAQFARVGITLVIHRVPPGQFPQRVIGDHDFDFALVTGAQGPDPDALRRRYSADTETGAYIGYADEEFREAVERGARAVEIDERAAAYYRAQEILARDIPFIPLAESVKVVVHNRRVRGLPQLEARGLVGSFDFSLVKLNAPRTDSRR
ncbi:MAG TPA: ABC transporter substrate-binding protein [Vicinamibacterales bacterium]|nr:ABC transporter substrate-binding protein [Vicinamibacterales bacterium]